MAVFADTQVEVGLFSTKTYDCGTRYYSTYRIIQCHKITAYRINKIKQNPIRTKKTLMDHRRPNRTIGPDISKEDCKRL